MQCVELVIRGRVQGVFFRKHTREKAVELGLNGQVQNKSDGSVYIIACGESSKLDAFIQWCGKGPDAAVVTSVEKYQLPLQSFNGFVIKKDNN